MVVIPQPGDPSCVGTWNSPHLLASELRAERQTVEPSRESLRSQVSLRPDPEGCGKAASRGAAFFFSTVEARDLSFSTPAPFASKLAFQLSASCIGRSERPQLLRSEKLKDHMTACMMYPLRFEMLNLKHSASQSVADFSTPPNQIFYCISIPDGVWMQYVATGVLLGSK
ncbi:hypothetical protein O181_044691 [Austropuccinia psidii MF-1]|uniref:Uncharacterized protein n=1 Tax=Austropuccinia psidii MF-1 TaxID=1389203 RepID=A0A9Q3DIU7_9BASI|nr:hypothetical protein [Austropuccinia psidii MF-1]